MVSANYTARLSFHCQLRHIILVFAINTIRRPDCSLICNRHTASVLRCPVPSPYKVNCSVDIVFQSSWSSLHYNSPATVDATLNLPSSHDRCFLLRLACVYILTPCRSLLPQNRSAVYNQWSMARGYCLPGLINLVAKLPQSLGR